MQNVLSSFLILVFSLLAQAQSLTNVSAVEELELLKNKISPQFPSEYRRFLEHDLDVISKIVGDNSGSRIHFQYFQGPVDGKTYLKWLNDNIDYINYDQNFSIGDAAGMAVSPFYNFVFKRGIILGPIYFQLFQSGRIPLLIHETHHLVVKSRHIDCGSAHAEALTDTTEIDSKLHSDLASADLSSNGRINACDDRPDGAYGVQFVFSSNLIKHCSNCGDDKTLPTLRQSDLYRRSVEALSRVREKKARTILIKDADE